MLELTVFITVNIESLNEFSNWISDNVNNKVRINNEIINITIEKKYLSISSFSVFSFINVTLLEYIWFGLVCDRRLFIEYFIKVKTLITLIPELVEKKEPPIITKIRNKNFKFIGVSKKDIPMFDTLLDIATNIDGKLLFEFKKTNEKEVTIKK